MTNRLPPKKEPLNLTPEEMEKAKLYTQNLVHQIEQELIGEIEKIEGRVPLPYEISRYGRQVLHKDLSMDYTWKGVLILTVKPNHENEDGQRGMLLTIHKQPEKVDGESS